MSLYLIVKPTESVFVRTTFSKNHIFPAPDAPEVVPRLTDREKQQKLDLRCTATAEFNLHESLSEFGNSYAAISPTHGECCTRTRKLQNAPSTHN